MTIVGPDSGFVDCKPVRTEVDGIGVCVVRIADSYFAIADTCSHAEFSLSTGDVWEDDCEIECPKHGAMFSLRTGEPQTLPATQAVAVFDVSVVEGNVVVSAR